MKRPTAFLDVQLDSSELALRQNARRFAETVIAPNANEWEEAEYFPDSLFRTAAQAGLLGVGFPEHLGGQGGTVMHQMMVTEGLIHGGSTGVMAGLGSLGIALPPILAGGSDDHVVRFVRPALAGDRIAALAITEPGAGSDVAGVRTRAVKDGGDYRISGSKLFITSGCRADFVTVLCRTSDDPHGGLTFFVVEKGMPGFTVSKHLRKTGWRASDTAELSFDDVRVPEGNRVGAPGSAFLTLMRSFQGERLALAAMGHASAEFLLGAAATYARDRKAFGKVLTGHQVIRHRLAEMATQVAAATSLNYAVGRRVALGDYLVAEVSMAKNFAADVATRVAYDAVQILGGMGYMRESAVERIARDVRLLPIGGGTTEIMNEIIGKTLGI